MRELGIHASMGHHGLADTAAWRMLRDQHDENGSVVGPCFRRVAQSGITRRGRSVPERSF
ncbi:hypothetical protein FHR84_003379 [Actinopolyspora biskrensis]|uniref:Uncharacterized protein n=1 Tax=Actinopolyspora biskrensis TaxID=1470178 RepID=A0A852Z1G6_9ACTN|nr:hypothetical protein [Actinopolyspora biskrensis]